MMIDREKRLWLFWPVILANSWESCITKYCISSDYTGKGAPKWKWQDIILLKPVNFEQRMLDVLDKMVASRKESTPRQEAFVAFVRKVGQGKAHPAARLAAALQTARLAVGPHFVAALYRYVFGFDHGHQR